MHRMKAKLSQNGVVRTNPMVIIDEPSTSSVIQQSAISIDSSQSDHDDDLYEELDDEDDSEFIPNTSTSVNSIKSSGERGTMPATIPLNTRLQSPPRCTVCRRLQDANVRLFRWPRDIKMRRKWCAFFNIDETEVALNLDHSYICSWHFDPDQFLYSDQKIFWAPDICPRHKIRKPANYEPFPWEISANVSIWTNGGNGLPVDLDSRIRKRPRHSPPKCAEIFFRQSKYRIAGKTKHPVAVLRLPNDPLLCYEFSYNRTSHIDGTKFYACLQCRKAKSETHVKDYIRTIHLDGTRLLSRGDPYAGHHFACKPIFDDNVPPPQNSNDLIVYNSNCGIMEERRDQSICPATSIISKSKLSQNISSSVQTDLSLSPMRSISHNQHINDPSTLFQTNLKPTTYCERAANVNDINAERFFVDDSSSVDHATESTQEASCSFVNPLGLTPRWISSNRRRNLFSKRSRSGLVPRCYICQRMLSNASQLVTHLKKHIREAPICCRCESERCEADAGVNVRKLRLCARCLLLQNYADESLPSLTDPSSIVTDETSEMMRTPIDCDDIVNGGQNDSIVMQQQCANQQLRDQLIVVD